MTIEKIEVKICPENPYPKSTNPMKPDPITGLRPDIFCWTIGDEKTPQQLKSQHNSIKNTRQGVCPFCGHMLNNETEETEANSFIVNNGKPIMIKMSFNGIKILVPIWVNVLYHEFCWSSSEADIIERSAIRVLERLS